MRSAAVRKMRQRSAERIRDVDPVGSILPFSGLGKEGPRYAIREMTEEKMVVIH